MRLLTIVDDFGRCDGRPVVLWGECFQVWNDRNPETLVLQQDLQQLLQQLAIQKLIDWYEESGKQVVQITQWQERVRDGVKERWPAKTSKSVLLQDLLQKLLPSTSSSPPSSSSPSPSKPATENAVELPRNFPASVDDAIKQAEGVGVETDFVLKTWDKAVSRGGHDSKGQPIRSWKAYVKCEWSYERDRLARNGNGHATKASVGPKLDEVVTEITNKIGAVSSASRAAGFIAHWGKRQWKRNGRLVDWREELSMMCAKWKQQ